MWQILEPHRKPFAPLAELGSAAIGKRFANHARNASDSLEILLMGMDLKSGDEVLTTTQDYPRMLTTLRQREKREGLKLKADPDSDSGEEPRRNHCGI